MCSVGCMRMCVQASVYLQPFASMGDVVECHSFPGRRIGHAHLSMYVSAIESQASAPGIAIDKGSRSLRVQNRCSHFCAVVRAHSPVSTPKRIEPATQSGRPTCNCHHPSTATCGVIGRCNCHADCDLIGRSEDRARWVGEEVQFRRPG